MSNFFSFPSFNRDNVLTSSALLVFHVLWQSVSTVRPGQDSVFFQSAARWVPFLIFLIRNRHSIITIDSSVTVIDSEKVLGRYSLGWTRSVPLPTPPTRYPSSRKLPLLVRSQTDCLKCRLVHPAHKIWWFLSFAHRQI